MMLRMMLWMSLLLGALQTQSQIRNPVDWDFQVRKIGEGQFEVTYTATLQKGWHIYSQFTPDGGPVPTRITVLRNPLLQLDGQAREVGKPEVRHEELFGVDVRQFSNKVQFVQKLRVKGKVKTALRGNIEYMTCNDKECLPPATVPFEISLQ